MEIKPRKKEEKAVEVGHDRTGASPSPEGCAVHQKRHRSSSKAARSSVG